MNLQQLNWKIHLQNPGDMHPHEWFRVFNTWIPNAPEIFVDVTDYKHVEDGPSILLAGHLCSFSLDSTGRRLGLLRDHRIPMEGENAVKLKSTLKSLLQGATRLEGDASFVHRPIFDAGDLKLVVNNRAIAANTEEHFQIVSREVKPLLEELLGSGGYTVKRDPDPRQRLTLHIKATQPQSSAAVLAKLG